MQLITCLLAFQIVKLLNIDIFKKRKIVPQFVAQTGVSPQIAQLVEETVVLLLF